MLYPNRLLDFRAFGNSGIFSVRVSFIPQILIVYTEFQRHQAPELTIVIHSCQYHISLGLLAKLFKGQGLIESLLEFIQDGMIKEVMGEKGMVYFPFVATLFLFVLVSNLIGLIPGSYTPTTQTGTVWGWALLVSAVFIFVGIREHGPIGYLRTWIPSGTPIPLMPVLFVLEGFSNLIIRPFSLGIRLFANMLAGHMVIALFLSFAIAGAIYIKPISFAFVLVMYAFEIFVAFLQAYIYAILTAIYIGGALEEH